MDRWKCTNILQELLSICVVPTGVLDWYRNISKFMHIVRL